VIDDTIDHRDVAKEGNDLHLSPAIGANPRVDLVHLPDHLGPALGRDAPELVLNNPERKATRNRRRRVSSSRLP
jgi:hypothetical protein